MPTGYTADVADGKVTDFRTFALRCARQFGATIMQRDDPLDEPPKHREPSDYYEKQLAQAKARYAELVAMTPEQAEDAARAEYGQRRAQAAEWQRKKDETRNRYNAMLAEVMAWEPPTAEHVGLKKFMIDQLVESRKFDCHNYASDEVERLDGADWLERERTRTFESIGRYAKEVAEEQARCDGANAWIDALYASLAPLASAGRATTAGQEGA